MSKLTLAKRFAARDPQILEWSPDINAAVCELRGEVYIAQEYAEDRAVAFSLVDEVVEEGFFPVVILKNPRDVAPFEVNINDRRSKRLYIGEGATLALAICAMYVQFRADNPKEGLGECDDRCTYAKGETCHCVCGGANHGSRVAKE